MLHSESVTTATHHVPAALDPTQTSVPHAAIQVFLRHQEHARRVAPLAISMLTAATHASHAMTLAQRVPDRACITAQHARRMSIYEKTGHA